MPTVQIQVWRSNQSAKDSAVADAICALEAPCKAFEDPHLSFSAAHNHVDAIYSAILSLWEVKADGEFAYPEVRMAHLLRLVGQMLVRFCQQAVSPASEPFWAQHQRQIRSDLQSVCDLLHLWQDQQLRQLMKDWLPGPESISQHGWDAAPFHDSLVDAFLSRIEEIKRLMALKAELHAALGDEHSAAVNSVFAPVCKDHAFQV